MFIPYRQRIVAINAHGRTWPMMIFEPFPLSRPVSGTSETILSCFKFSTFLLTCVLTAAQNTKFIMFSNPADLPPATNKDERTTIIQTASKQKSGYNNPCVKEQELSYKCLSENNYDKEKCAVVFANYGACREFWGKVQAHRRLKGIRPYLPWPEEREKIKEEYIKKFNLGSKLPNAHTSDKS